MYEGIKYKYVLRINKLMVKWYIQFYYYNEQIHFEYIILKCSRKNM